MNVQRNSIFFSIFLLLLILGADKINSYIQYQSAAAFLKERISERDLRRAYKDGDLRILIVPGHNNKTIGAEFDGVRETDLNVEIAHHLSEFLERDPNIDTFVTRKKNGEFERRIAWYFEDNENKISSFREKVMTKMAIAFEEGIVDRKVGVPHNAAKEEVALELYGINKFANDKKYVLVIHTHVNDQAGRRWNKEGDYHGFAVYMPERQLPNYRASKGVAMNIKEQLEKVLPISTLPKENIGLIEDQELIAIGSNGSLDAASVLVEYGYIYEPQFKFGEMRDLYLKEIAYQTYLGITDYFSKDEMPRTATLPFEWGDDLKLGDKESADIFALQLALLQEGLYPPEGKNFYSCPISGNFGECTEQAVKAFQEKYSEQILLPSGLAQGTGYFGGLTREVLNDLYSK